VTESDVRIVVHVHNDVFINFVHGISVYPKPHLFGQLHAENALMALTCFKFRILTGPRLHPDAKAAQAAASRAYRARKRAEKAAIDARKTRPIESDTIALDHIPPWRR